MDNVRKIYGDKIVFSPTPYDALEGADVLAIVTEWNEFRNPDFNTVLEKLRSPVIFDGRNLFDPEKMQERGFHYSGIGLESQSKPQAH